MSLHDTSAGSLSLVSETAIDTGDDLIFTAEEFDRFDHNLKRNLASQAQSDEINGKSNKLEMRAYFVCQHTLLDFE